MIELTEEPQGSYIDVEALVQGYSVDKLPLIRYHLENRQDHFAGLRSVLLDLFSARSPEVVLLHLVDAMKLWENRDNPELASYMTGLLSLLLADEPEDPEHPSPKATDELVAAFVEAYAVPGFEQPDPERVRRALNTALRAAPASIVVARGFIASGDTNQSDGMGPSYEIGRYATLEEAQAAARGKGVQGDPGTVDSFETVVSSDGEVKTRTRRLIERRRTPDGSYFVGFLDFREYEYGLRPAAIHPLRPAPTSIMALDKFALSESESLGYQVVSPSEVRQRLLSDRTVYGLWRQAGDTRWRGEFEGSSEKDLDRWLPERRNVADV